MLPVRTRIVTSLYSQPQSRRCAQTSTSYRQRQSCSTRRLTLECDTHIGRSRNGPSNPRPVRPVRVTGIMPQGTSCAPAVIQSRISLRARRILGTPSDQTRNQRAGLGRCGCRALQGAVSAAHWQEEQDHAVVHHRLKASRASSCTARRLGLGGPTVTRPSSLSLPVTPSRNLQPECRRRPRLRDCYYRNRRPPITYRDCRPGGSERRGRLGRPSHGGPTSLRLG